jgi:iron complex outermembrane receptor protein
MVKIEPADTFALLLSGEYYYQNDNGNPWHYVGPGRPDVVPLGTRLGGVVPQDPRDIASNRDSARESRVSGLAAIATWTPLPGLAVKSTTAYRDSFSDSTSDADGSSPALLRLDHTESARQFSQELQLTYQDDRVEAVGGLYYFDERVSGSTLVRLLFVNPFAFAGSGPGVGNTKAYAAYGQLGVKLTDALTVTGALRYSHEKRDAVGSSGGVPVPFREASWNSLTPKVIVDYQVSDRIKLYASAGKGFKSGTFLIGNANPVVNPENVWAYEAGIKSEFLDRRLQVNLAAFWYDYTDLQVSRVVGNTTLTENAASARIRGVEAEISARPMERNTFSVNGAYLDARFQDYRTPDAVRPELGALNLAGKHLPYSPKWTFNIRDEQRFPVGADQEISVSADYTYTSRLYHDPFNLMSRGSDAYGIFNARVAYEVGGGDWSIALWGRNLTDKLVRTTTIASVAAVGFPLIGSLNEPPSYGIDLAVRF